MSARTLTALAEQTVIPDAVLEIFSGLTAADPEMDLDDTFSPAAAERFLGNIGNAAQLLSVNDTYETALQKLDDAIAAAERVRNQLLSKIFEQVRPLERSYRSVQLFFENAATQTAAQSHVDFAIINADATAIKRPGESAVMEALTNYVKSRNDSFDFRRFINNIVVPGYVPDQTRKALEELSEAWGMLLIGDLRDHKSYDSLIAGFGNNGGIYQSLKRPQNQATADVIVASHVKLRDRHLGIEDGADDGLYAPASMLFAGALVRTDRTAGIAQGPVGFTHGKVKGTERARFEPLISQVTEMVVERQLVTIIRNADNDLCFIGNRSQAEDPAGLMKFFTTYRVFRLVERMVANYARQVVGMALDRKVVETRVEEPIRELLVRLQKERVIQRFDLTVEKDEALLSQGVVDMNIALLPVGPAETFRITIKQRPPAAAAKV